MNAVGVDVERIVIGFDRGDNGSNHLAECLPTIHLNLLGVRGRAIDEGVGAGGAGGKTNLNGAVRGRNGFEFN